MDDDRDEMATEAAEPAFYTVAPCLADRAYGGPEEGGWWYDHGEPCEDPDLPMPSVHASRADANAARAAMQAQLDAGPNVGRPPKGSVLSRGTYEAVAFEGYPKAWPERAPRYE